MTRSEMADAVRDEVLSLLSYDFSVALGALGATEDLLGNSMRMSGYMNFRDALSHLCHALDPKEDELTQLKQAVWAREHVRRAALEPLKEWIICTYEQAAQEWKLYLKEDAAYARLNCLDERACEVEERLASIRNSVKRCRCGQDGSNWDTMAADLAEVISYVKETVTLIDDLRFAVAELRHGS